MKKIKLFIIFLFIFLVPFSVSALSPKYEDKIFDIVGEEKEEEKINIYFFFGDGCPHCAKEERFFNDLKKEYGESYNLYMYETWYDDSNVELMKQAKERMNVTVDLRVPFTVIGDEAYIGYNDSVGVKIETTVKEYLEIISEDEAIAERYKVHIPLIGDIDKRDVSIGVVAVILGFIDGFNPCAMWVLLFLINMLIGMNDKKKMLIIGTTFLFTSAVMYFLFMLGITNILSFIATRYVRAVIGAVALIIGIYNVVKFFRQRKEEDGCHVVDEKKRKKIFERIKKFTTEKNFLLALGGVVLLAISVNLVELACSSVFPATFAEILAVNNISGIARIVYLLIYTLFYMIDDFIVFVIAVVTLELSTTSTKYGKYSAVVAGIIMIIVGILLMFKPEWIMLNF